MEHILLTAMENFSGKHKWIYSLEGLGKPPSFPSLSVTLSNNFLKNSHAWQVLLGSLIAVVSSTLQKPQQNRPARVLTFRSNYHYTVPVNCFKI